MMKRRSNRNLIVGLGLANVALIVAAMLSYMAKTSLKRDSSWVYHTHEVLVRLIAFKAAITEIETGERGYLATGDKEFLASVDEAEASVWQLHEELLRLTLDNASQQKKLKDLHALTVQKLHFANAIIDLRTSGNDAEAQRLVATKQGKRLMDNVFALVTTLTKNETALRQQRLQKAEVTDHRTSLLILLSFALAAVVGGMTLTVFDRDRRARVLVEREAQAYIDVIKGVFDSSLAGIMVMHAILGKDGKPKDFIIKAANKLSMRLSHREGGSLLDKSLLEISPQNLNNGLVGNYSDVYTTGEHKQWQMQATLPDGELRWFEIACVPVPLGIAVSFTDVTDRKEAEQTILQQKQLLDGVLTNMPVIIFSYLRDGTITRSIGSGIKTLGIVDDTLLTHNIYQVWPHLVSELKAVFKEKKSQLFGTNPNGEPTYFFDTYLFVDNTNAGQVTGFALDVTEGRIAGQNLADAKARAELASVAKTRFLANMSHEIRTPLSAILGFAEVLRQENTNPIHTEYLDHISSAGTTLLKLIGDILDLTKIEEGKMALSAERFHVAELLTSVIYPYAFKAKEKGLYLNLSIAEGMPAYAAADSNKLGQVVINLLGNALKFTQTGGIEVRVESEEPDEQGQFRLTVTIADTGIGIEEDKLDQIFNAFTQADAGISRRFGGSGLGLSIVQEMVNLLGGEIFVESPAHPGNVAGASAGTGPGTKFIFWIPLQIEQRQEHDPADTTEPDTPIPSGLRVLMAEDNEVNQHLARLILNGAGVEVDMAGNGQIALEMARAQRYAMVFMDVQMPVLDGLAATRAIRIEDPYIPIIGLSANVYREDVENCFEAGMSDFVAKPYNADRLIEKVRHYAQRDGHGKEADSLLAGIRIGKANPNKSQQTAPMFSFLRHLTGNNPHEMRTLIAAYLTVQEDFLQRVEAFHLNSASALDLSAAAHKLKATVSLVGLEDQLAPLQSLEEMARHTPLAPTLAANAGAIAEACLRHLPTLTSQMQRLE